MKKSTLLSWLIAMTISALLIASCTKPPVIATLVYHGWRTEPDGSKAMGLWRMEPDGSGAIELVDPEWEFDSTIRCVTLDDLETGARNEN